MNESPSTGKPHSAPQDVQATNEPSGEFGRYTIVQRIGDDSSCVFLAQDGKLGRTIALRINPDPTPEGEAAFARFTNGARVASGERLPGVGEVFEIGDVDGRSFIAREWVVGVPFRNVAAATSMTLEDHLRQVERIARVVSEVHRAGVIHGNLGAGNIVFSDDRGPVLVDFVDCADALRDLHAVGSLLEMVLLRHARAGRTIEPALRTLRDRTRAGPDQYASVESFRAELAAWTQRRGGTIAVPGGRRVRGALMAAVGYVLLLHCLSSLIIHGIGAYWSSSPGVYGTVALALLQEIGLPFLIGAYLLIAGLRGLGWLPSRRTDADSWTLHRSAMADEHATRPSKASPQPPAGSCLSVERTERRFCVRRPLGAWPGATLAMLSVATCLVGIALVARQTIPGGVSHALAGAAFLLIETCVCVCLIRWLWVRPVRVNPVGSRNSNIKSELIALIASWIGREQLTIAEGECRHEAVAGFLRVGRTVPVNDLWDVVPGSVEAGIEIATSGGPIRMGKQLGDDERHWLCESTAREIARERGTHPDSSDGSSIVHPPAHRAAARGFVIWALWVFAWVFVPVNALIQIAESVASGLQFSTDSPFRSMEARVNLAVVLANVIVAPCLYLEGARRLRRLRKSGARLFKAGYWLQIGSFVAMYGIVAVWQANGIMPYVPVTPAMNASCLAASLNIVFSTACVLTLSITQPRLPLIDD